MHTFRVFSFFRVLAGLFILATSGGILSAEEPTADEVINRAIQNRLAITDYEIEVAFNYGETAEEGRTNLGHYYLHGEQLRVDLRYPYTQARRFPGLTKDTFWERNVYTRTRSICFCNMLGSGQRAINFDSDPRRTVPDWQEALTRYDLRTLGFHSSGASVGIPIRTIFDLAANEKKIAEETVNEIDCLRVSFDLESGVQCDFWFAPSCSYAPVQVRSYFEPLDLTENLELKVEEWGRSGLWFPTRYTSTESVGNKTLASEEGRLVIHSLNGPLPGDTFQLSGLNIPKGKSIQRLPSDGPAKIWDGEKIVLKRER
ncbi:hypothetical protein [Rubinisphaera margarita]|uniref:hypothetical protein n=1 Tax=Rubinisphaera margarita TaxID=2909586 RepID=UPI001EE849C2|nr:hypothetical protein [Rubinisphaera margarita]MCG6155473.1 hypothetical protein [Rubinisphaera margarita]